MKPLSSILPKKIPQKKAVPWSQWSDLVGRFLTAYNLSSRPEYRIKHERMAMRLAPLLKANGINWLEWFYTDCEKRANFGRYFNWAISSKNVNKH